MTRYWLEHDDAAHRAWLAAVGEPAFRAKQIDEWIARGVTDVAAMTNLSRSLREYLARDWEMFSLAVAARSRSSDETQKAVYRLRDGQTIESVLIEAADRKTVCLSTQVGCGMGCVFCASGIDGVVRNLSPSEMKEQLIDWRGQLPTGERLTHIVVMGMGEPLANLESLLEALSWATDPNGLGISGRHVTISTVGLPNKIIELAQSGRPYHLAVSLHAPNDELRRRIVPTATKWGVVDLLVAADEYRSITKRQVTFEYVLLGGLNDQPTQAAELVRLLGPRDALVNLIPYNPVVGLPYATPTPARVAEFATILRQAQLVVKVRERKGATIDAACGQLRRQHTPALVTLA